MQVLWDPGEATVAGVRDELKDDRPLAYTTLATMLTKMERNGQVAHRTEGRIHVYRPVLRREQVSQSMVVDLAGRLFQGDVAELVSHLLDGRDVSREELARLKAFIRQKEREVKNAE